MKYVLKEMSKDELPREKLKKYGPKYLSDYELLAVILKSGIKGKSVLDISIEMMNSFKNITMIDECSIDELREIKGIGEAKALEIIASIELGKRIITYIEPNISIYKAKDAYDYIKKEFINLKQEHFYCVYVNNKQKIICHKLICIGTDNQTFVDYKSAFKWALKFSACGIVFFHNHPSGDPHPSNEDIIMTEQFIKMCKNLGFVYYDHIIVGKGMFYSFKTNRIIKESD